MKTLFLTVGLPRSGKSTWAKKIGYPIVNRDSIRLALHGQAYIKEAESMVTAIEDYMVKALFLAGHDKIIIDATHLQEKYIKRWKKDDRNIVGKIFDTPKDVCIERAIADGREDLIPIIERMDESKEIDLEDDEKLTYSDLFDEVIF
jgi:predicted kinase